MRDVYMCDAEKPGPDSRDRAIRVRFLMPRTFVRLRAGWVPCKLHRRPVT